jgi:cytochrome c-type biogenesis protein CcmH/NrfG
MTSAQSESGFTAPVTGPRSLVRVVDTTLPGLFGVATVGGVAAASGGYFPDLRAWTALGLLWLLFILLVVRSVVPVDRTAAVYLGGLVLLTSASALSLLWTKSVTLTVLDFEKLLVYVGVVAAGLLIVRRCAVPQLLAGMLGGIVLVCAYALATRLFPERLGTFDPIAGYRLTRPVGYWNALGIFAGLGLLLAVSFAARARTPWSRALAGASLPLLMATFLFTFSRGAWLALAVGVVAAVALDPRRLQLLVALLVLMPCAALAAALGYRAKSLTTTTASLTAASHDGHRLAVWLLVLSLVSAAVALALALCEDVVRPGAGTRRAFAAALVLIVVAGAAFVWVDRGSPVLLVRRGYDAVLAPPKHRGHDVSQRLLDLSSNGRIALWRVGWREFASRPLGGTGAGTFELAWMEHRPSADQARDTHNLYLQTLAELGVLGLAALLVCLAAPLVATWRSRRNPLVSLTFGAYVAFLVHGAVDWDWQLTGVGAAGLLCGVALVRSGRGSSWGLRSTARWGAAALALLLAGFAFVAVMSNVPLATAESNARSGDWSASASAAHKATAWAPWSSQPWRLYGEAELAQAHIAVARRAFRTALAKDPHDPDLWIDLAIATTGAERRRALATAVSLDPRDPDVRDLSRRALIRRSPVRKPPPSR